MKSKNVIITIVVVLIAAVSLLAKIARVELVSKVVLSANAGEDVEQKRKLVWTYHQQGNRQSAIQAAEEYLELAPRDSEVWVLLAEHYMGSDKLTEAERAIKEALKLNPNSLWGLRTSAGIYRLKAEQSPQLKQKYLSMAQLDIEKALGIAPDDEHVNEQAAQIYLVQGERNKALQAVNKALELEPEEKRLLDLKKQILSGTE